MGCHDPPKPPLPPTDPQYVPSAFLFFCPINSRFRLPSQYMPRLLFTGIPLAPPSRVFSPPGYLKRRILVPCGFVCGASASRPERPVRRPAFRGNFRQSLPQTTTLRVPSSRGVRNGGGQQQHAHGTSWGCFARVIDLVRSACARWRRRHGGRFGATRDDCGGVASLLFFRGERICYFLNERPPLL